MTMCVRRSDVAVIVPSWDKMLEIDGGSRCDGLGSTGCQGSRCIMYVLSRLGARTKARLELLVS